MAARPFERLSAIRFGRVRRFRGLAYFQRQHYLAGKSRRRRQKRSRRYAGDSAANLLGCLVSGFIKNPLALPAARNRHQAFIFTLLRRRRRAVIIHPLADGR